MGRNRIGLRRSARGQGGGGGVSYPFTIATVAPSSVAAGAGDTVITVNGGVYPGSAVVFVGGVAMATVFVNAGQLTATVPAAVVAVPGFKAVQVRDGTDASNNYPWSVAFPVPTLTLIAPDFAYLGESPPSVATTGSGFFPSGTGALVDDAIRPWTYASATSGSVALQPEDLLAAGVLPVVMANLPPGGGLSASQPFSVRYRAPAITGASPTTIAAGSSDTPVTLTDSGGSYYNPAAWPDGGTVGSVDAVAVATAWLSATQVELTIPAAMLVTAGTKALTVANPTVGGGGGTSAPFNLTVSGGGGAPTLDPVTPSGATQHDDPVTITCPGTGFTVSSVVYADAVALATTFVSATELTAVLTTGLNGVLSTSGPKAITVDDPSGTSNAQTFAVTAWSVLNIATIRGAWKASDVVLSGSNITQFNDRTGNGRHAAQPTGTKQGLLIASDARFNNKPTVDLDGVDDMYSVTAVSTLAGAQFEFVAIYRFDALPTAGTVAAPYGAAGIIASSSGFFGTTARTGPLQLFGYTNDGTYDTVTNTGILATTPQWYRFRREAGTNYVSVSGNAEVSLVCGNISTQTGIVQIGSANASGFMNGQFAEGFACNGPMTAIEAIRTKNYINAEYAI